ncbi:MAG: helix-turn-helix domain-containing protein, partial [Deltaproteobacteria bacterium]|nr:helix-turn-helix domain-containing protein [Deltaproteobacteria bacterium]
MAEPGNIAFGRYLRALRERRALSLLEVASLSQAFAETLNKGYLSRVENGRQRLAFAKLIPLGRIYKVAADVLLERLELDLELERVGAPDTEGLDLEELRRR